MSLWGSMGTCTRCGKVRSHKTTVTTIGPEGLTIPIEVVVCKDCRHRARRENSLAYTQRGAGKFRGRAPWRS